MAAQTTVEAAPDVTAPPDRVWRGPTVSETVQIALMMLPAALVVYFSFNGGGFFAGSVGFAGVFLIQLLIARVLLADRPFDGYSRAFMGVGIALTAFAGWVLLSGTWADALNRTLVEFDRALLYALVFALMGCIARSPSSIQWVVRWLALAMLVVCTCALITRVLPDVWPTAPSFANDRLSYPLTYWNALGILAGCGALLAVGIAASLRERVVIRALGAAATPVFASTLFFTFSRGAIVATIFAAVVFVIVSRSPGLIGALLATLPFTVVALVVAYHAGELATEHPATPTGVSQGKDVALAVALCALGAALTRVALRPLDRRLERVRIDARARQIRRWLALGTAGLAIVIALAAGAPSWISDQYHVFTRSAPLPDTDFRARLTNPSSNGRTEHWRVAANGLKEETFHGYGAGTYEHIWEARRRNRVVVVDAHSLYLELGDELGIVGLGLVVGVILAILIALYRRAAGPNRPAYIALFVATLAWAIHAGVDWDWEMPAVTAWVFAVGGVALARRSAGAARPPSGQRGRIPLAVVLLLMAATPAFLLFSQSRLGAAANAFESGDCQVAQQKALASINALAVRPEPYQILGYCDIEQGRAPEAVAAMRKAVDIEPGSWEYHYSLGVAQAAGGVNPMPELELSHRLNPREDLPRDALKLLRKVKPRQWPASAKVLARKTVDSRRLTVR